MYWLTFRFKSIQIIHGIWKMCRDRLLNFELFAAYQELINKESISNCVCAVCVVFCLVKWSANIYIYIHIQTRGLYFPSLFFFFNLLLYFYSVYEWNEWSIMCNEIDVYKYKEWQKVLELRYSYETNKIPYKKASKLQRTAYRHRNKCYNPYIIHGMFIFVVIYFCCLRALSVSLRVCVYMYPSVYTSAPV